VLLTEYLYLLYIHKGDGTLQNQYKIIDQSKVKYKSMKPHATE